MIGKLRINRIWWRNVQPGEFYNIERHHKISGGGGALYIEIPSSIVSKTLDFLKISESRFDKEGSIEIKAFVIGESSASGTIEFKKKTGNRMRIANQNRQQPNSKRHPAWTVSYGFPSAPDSVSSKAEAMKFFPEGGLRIYIVETLDNKYYAGFTKGYRPSSIEEGDFMYDLYSSKVGGLIIVDPSQLDDDSNNTGDVTVYFEDPSKVRMHYRVERNSKLITAVKELKGYVCEVCDFDFKNKYGEIGSKFIEAHHLVPISELKDGKVNLDPRDDFAVLCSNCHRMIHRLEDPSDLKKLKNSIRNAANTAPTPLS